MYPSVVYDSFVIIVVHKVQCLVQKMETQSINLISFSDIYSHTLIYYDSFTCA